MTRIDMALLPAPGEPDALYLLDLPGLARGFFHTARPMMGPSGEPVAVTAGVIGALTRILRRQDPAYLAAVVNEAIKGIGLRTIGEVLKSQQFRSAARFVNSQIPERAAIATNKPTAPQVIASTEDPELINLALQYLIFLGYSTTEASNYVAGKKV